MSQVINEIRYEIKMLSTKKLFQWTYTENYATKYRFNEIAFDVMNLLWDKYKICDDADVFKKYLMKRQIVCGIEKHIMQSLNKIGLLSRINARQILKNYNQGYDLYGRAISKMSFDEMISDIQKNQRRLMALGARLADGLDKQMTFKTNLTEDLNCFQFVKRGDDYYIHPHSTHYANMGYHICLALSVMKEVGTIEYKTGVKCPSGPNRIMIYRPLNVELMTQQPVPMRSNEKYSDQIELFTKQIEELTASIKQYDDEIFRLSELSSKAKTERQKLLKVIELLKG